MTELRNNLPFLEKNASEKENVDILVLTHLNLKFDSTLDPKLRGCHRTNSLSPPSF